MGVRMRRVSVPMKKKKKLLGFWEEEEHSSKGPTGGRKRCGLEDVRVLGLAYLYMI